MCSSDLMGIAALNHPTKSGGETGIPYYPADVQSAIPRLPAAGITEQNGFGIVEKLVQMAGNYRNGDG